MGSHSVQDSFGPNELAPLVDRSRGQLLNLGVARGTRVGWQIAPGIDAVALHVALLSLGAVSVPLFPSATDAEVAWVRADAGLSHFLTGWACDGPPVSADRHPDPDDEAVLLYTSGTTGRPKGVPITHRHLQATVEALHLLWGWSDRDVILHVLPLHHVHGLIVALHGALHARARIVFSDARDGPALTDALHRSSASVFMAVPTHYRRLLQAEGNLRFGALRLCTSGSAPLPAAVHRDFTDKSGLTIVERYGMTEIGMAFSNRIGDCRAGTVGSALPHVRWRIVQDGGQDAAAGAVGELWVAGPNVFAGYLNQPVATEETLVDGWMKTGDLGWVDETGILTLVGRRSERINVGGFKVSPGEVEAVLAEVPLVTEVAVFGVEDTDLGEVCWAAVVGAVALEDLQRAAHKALSPYKRPRRYLFVDSLPRNAMGKVHRHSLRDVARVPRVRPARPDERHRIAAWNQAMALETEDHTLDPAVISEGVSGVFRDKNAARYWIAEIAGEPAGQLMITTEWSDWRNRWVWWIQSVYVPVAFRRRGVYRALHASVLTEARAAGAAGVRLYVDARNARAMDTYRALGMDGEHYRVFETMFQPETKT